MSRIVAPEERLEVIRVISSVGVRGVGVPSEKESGVRFVMDIIAVERVGRRGLSGADVGERGVRVVGGREEGGRERRCWWIVLEGEIGIDELGISLLCISD